MFYFMVPPVYRSIELKPNKSNVDWWSSSSRGDWFRTLWKIVLPLRKYFKFILWCLLVETLNSIFLKIRIFLLKWIHYHLTMGKCLILIWPQMTFGVKSSTLCLYRPLAQKIIFLSNNPLQGHFYRGVGDYSKPLYFFSLTEFVYLAKRRFHIFHDLKNDLYQWYW